MSVNPKVGRHTSEAPKTISERDVLQALMENADFLDIEQPDGKRWLLVPVPAALLVHLESIGADTTDDEPDVDGEDNSDDETDSKMPSTDA
ncbi:MAG: hypothetical protein K2P94_08480 [Rhodospirillaceae bacterium]|nr:hypothetical protein [Rhodospirillaceae bacterium]